MAVQYPEIREGMPVIGSDVERVGHVQEVREHDFVLNRPRRGDLLSTFPDMHITVEDQVAEGDRVVTRWTGRGTYNGGLPMVDAVGVGTSVTVTGMTFTRITSGKIMEDWIHWDALSMLQQLGAIPQER